MEIINGKHYSRRNEMQILGIMMLFPEAKPFIEKINQAWFYDDRHKRIFGAIMELSLKGSFSIISVATFMCAKDPSDKDLPYYLTRCTDEITGVYGFKYGIAMLEGMAGLRRAESRSQDKTVSQPTINRQDNEFD